MMAACSPAAMTGDWRAAWAEVLAQGYERLVAKDLASPYVGGRTLKWLKVEQSRYREGERGWAKGAPDGRWRENRMDHRYRLRLLTTRTDCTGSRAGWISD